MPTISRVVTFLAAFSGWFVFASVCTGQGKDDPQPLLKMENFTSKGVSAALYPDGSKVAIGVTETTDAGKLEVIDLATKSPVGEPVQVLSARTVIVTPDGRTIITAGENLVVTFDAMTLAQKTAWNVDGRDSIPAVSKDGKRVIAWDFNPRITTSFWDTESKKQVGDRFSHGDELLVVRFSPDGTRAVTGCSNGEVRIWDTSSGEPIGEPLKHTKPVRTASFSSDSSKVLVCEDIYVTLWDLATRKPLAKVGHKDTQAVAIHPKGESFITGDYNGAARIWNATTGKQIGSPMLHGARAGVLDVVYSPDGATVATGCDLGFSCIWDSTTGKPVSKRMKQGSRVNKVEFSTDGKRLLSLAFEGMVTVWEVEKTP